MRTKWYDDEGNELPSSRLAWSDFVVIGTDYLSAISHATAMLLQGAKGLVMQHANYEADAANFHSEAALAIENMTEGTDG